jgi:tetratricopeptide (TPR) repeat protein
LVADDPSEVFLKSSLAGDLGNMGNVHARGQQFERALMFYERARAIQESIVVANPEDAHYASQLAHGYDNMGNALSRLGRTDEALVAYRDGLRMREVLVQKIPQAPELRLHLARSCCNLGSVLLENENIEEASGPLLQARDTLNEVLTAHPDAHEIRSQLSIAFHLLATQCQKQEKFDEAITNHMDSIEYARAALKQTLNVVRYKSLLSQFCAEAAKLQRKLGNHAEAVALAVERKQLWPDNPIELYNAACDLSLCVPLVGAGKPELTADEMALRARYGEQAIDAFQRAIQAGFKDVGLIHKNADLDPIRSRPDFQTIMIELRAKIQDGM